MSFSNVKVTHKIQEFTLIIPCDLSTTVSILNGDEKTLKAI